MRSFFVLSKKPRAWVVDHTLIVGDLERGRFTLATGFRVISSFSMAHLQADFRFRLLRQQNELKDHRGLSMIFES
jgi:hypothetical protein